MLNERCTAGYKINFVPSNAVFKILYPAVEVYRTNFIHCSNLDIKEKRNLKRMMQWPILSAVYKICFQWIKQWTIKRHKLDPERRVQRGKNILLVRQLAISLTTKILCRLTNCSSRRGWFKGHFETSILYNAMTSRICTFAIHGSWWTNKYTKLYDLIGILFKFFEWLFWPRAWSKRS